MTCVPGSPSTARAALVNVRLAGTQNVLQCNRQHPLIQQGQFVAPSKTVEMSAAEFVARIRADRADRGLAPLVYGADERLYLQSHATPGVHVYVCEGVCSRAFLHPCSLSLCTAPLPPHHPIHGTCRHDAGVPGTS